MKILADENIPNFVIVALRRKGYEVLDLKQKSRGAKDKEVIRIAKKEKSLLLTFDKDFIDYYNQLKEFPPTLVLDVIPQNKENINKVVRFVLKTKLLEETKGLSIVAYRDGMVEVLFL